MRKDDSFIESKINSLHKSFSRDNLIFILVVATANEFTTIAVVIMFGIVYVKLAAFEST